METDDPNNFTQSEQNAQTSDASLACNCCRKRKLRCSRETPICEHCRRTGQECVYETKRAKPGMRAGAIENVHRRLDALEQTIAKQQITIETLCAKDTSNNERSPRQEAVDGQSLLLSLAKEICKLGDVPESIRNVSHKRRRTDDDDRSQPWAYTIHQPPLPDDITLDQVLNAYFRQVHPWMPMIHEARLRRRLQEGGDKTNLIPLLQAIMLIAHRYVARKDVAESIHDMLGDPEDVRDWVVAKATKSLSLESLQSLIVICYLDIGDGEESRAWSPIGALTRMVEYLQITTECEEASRLSFSQPYISLHPPQGWTESEERRRVFWCVFNLDRFCSVTTGWNTSLTSDDVNRRLPCDGIAWRKEDPVSTPYFGIWDRSAGRIGNPIAFPLSHSVAPPTVVDEDGVTPLDAMTSPEAVVSAVDMSTVGAFAYCIEATESMSRVMTYFLQQKVNIKDQKNLSSWLTRFKELDVRLVHWKMLLPRKWKVDISHQSSASKMDPNLTLAHVTHNASMILLHQPIAFPPSNWTFKTRLPSFCSLETCHAAAVEIATITDHYLRIATLTGPLSNQFAFCVYLAARVLLLHWRYCVTDTLSPEFWVLLESLGSMAKRWKGPHQLGPGENLASKYWSVLTELHTQCMQNGSFSINPSAYTTEVKHVKGSLNATQKAQSQQVSNGEQQTQTQVFPNGFPQRSSTPWRQMTDICLLQNVETQQDPPGATGNAFSSSAPSNAVAGQDPHRSRSVGSEDLGVISQMLLDAEFVDMDRVISFDDGIFGMDNEGGCF